MTNERPTTGTTPRRSGLVSTEGTWTPPDWLQTDGTFMSVNLPEELKDKSAIQRVVKLEPATIRGAALAITSLVAIVIGRNVDISWLEPLLNAWAIIAPLIAGVLIRGKVTPNVRAATGEVVLGEVLSKVDVIYNEIAENVLNQGRHALRENQEKMRDG